MKLKWGYIKMSLVIALAFFLFAFAKQRNEKRILSEVNLHFTNSQNLYLTEEAVNKLLIQNEVRPKRVGKETLDLNRVESLLEAHEMIENAEVFLSIDGVMGAAITQRQPLARIVEQEQYYVDRQGLKMPLSKYHSARVPLVTGLEEDGLNELHPLVSHVQKDPFLRKHVTRIHRLEGGLYQVYLRELDFVVSLGTLNRIEYKFNNFKAFYHKAMKDKKLDTYKKVDLQFGNQVVCTKK